MGQFRARKTVPLPLRFPKESLKGTIRLGGGGKGCTVAWGRVGPTLPPTTHAVTEIPVRGGGGAANPISWKIVVPVTSGGKKQKELQYSGGNLSRHPW